MNATANMNEQGGRVDQKSLEFSHDFLLNSLITFKKHALIKCI